MCKFAHDRKTLIVIINNVSYKIYSYKNWFLVIYRIFAFNPTKQWLKWTLDEPISIRPNFTENKSILPKKSSPQNKNKKTN